jgi:hypothetical protein
VVDASSELAVSSLFADVARELNRDDEPTETLRRIVDVAASAVPGAQHVAISTLDGAGTLTASVDGTTVLTSTLPTASVKVGSITYAVPTGARFGFITWSSTTANLSGIQAVVAP